MESTHRGLSTGVPYAAGSRGVVAAKHLLAAQAGVGMLEAGGNAVDAAVAAAFASGVVEPWMSGLGGVGYLVVQPATGGPAQVVNYSAVAPRSADAGTFEVVEGTSTGLFPWPLVRDDANQQGWRAPAVPGTARGLGLALERFGRLPLARVLRPAIALAADGVPVSWYTTLRIAVDAATLSRYPDTARTFLPQGVPLTPPASAELHPTRLVQADLAATLERLARFGVDEVYTGETARRIVAAMATNAGLLDATDLAAYQAEVQPALEIAYRGWRIGTPGGPSGGPTLARIIEALPAAPAAAYGSLDYVDTLLHALRTAFAQRYAGLGDDTRAGAPLGTSTTHVAVADTDGMVVSCTQTLVSAFGARVTVPGTGILLNNGMYWFDPRPGQRNSVGPRKRPLSNMTPLVAVGPGGWPRLGLGSSGGRRIVSANAQLLLAVIDGELGLDAALRAPRIDASGDQVLADLRLPDALLAGLTARGWAVHAVEESPYPQHFASPVGVAALHNGERHGAADQLMPAAVAAW